MDFLNYLIDTYNIPLLSAFLLGIINSISPCTLATNVTAVSYISKNLSSTKQTMIHSLVYALGRIFSYTIIIFLIWGGLSQFNISIIFQSYGEKIIGPVLVFIGLVMLNIIKIPHLKGSDNIQKFKAKLSKKGYLGTFLIGVLFALAFCPYSGLIFFGIFMPLVLKSSFPLGLGILYGLGTAIPVIFFSILFVVSIKKMSIVFNAVGKIEKYLRYFIASIFVLVGIYYSYITIKWLFVIF